MTRSTMSYLIEQLRGMTDAGTADYTIGTANYWDNTHLQVVLDRHRTEFYFHETYPIATRSGGTVSYTIYQTGLTNIEETDGGTAVFVVEDSVGNDQAGTLYTVDYMRGIITFGADQLGTAYYVTGQSYDLNASAADIWRQKAGHYAAAVNFSTDNHSISRSDLQKNALNMANYYSQMAGGGVVVQDMYRSDAILEDE